MRQTRVNAVRLALVSAFVTGACGDRGPATTSPSPTPAATPAATTFWLTWT